MKGIICFNAGMTLRDGDREYYYSMLDKLFPNLTRKYIRNYGNSYNVVSQNNEELMSVFLIKFAKNTIFIYNPDECFKYTSEYVEEDNYYSIFSLFFCYVV